MTIAQGKDRSWFFVILVITLAYLIVELSFSSTLLNIVSGQASSDDVDHIEKWGRLISGFAAGLVLWSVFTPWSKFTPRLFRGDVPRTIGFNILLTIVAMVVAFHWEKSIVDNAQDNSSGADRKLAVYASFLRGGLIDGTLSLDGMPAGDNAYADPDGKAFIALSPLLTITQASMKGRVDGVIRNVVAEKIRESIGGSRGFYNTVFIPSAYKMNEAWSRYLVMIQRLNQAQKQADRIGNSTARSRIIHRSRSTFDRGIADAFSIPGEPPARIDPNSIHNSSQFFKNPVIARFWANQLGIKDVRPMMPNDSFTTIEHDVWPVFLNEKVEAKIRDFNANPEQYADGGPLAKRGKDAVALLTVPALALMLSVLFTLVHASKITYYLTRLIHSRIPKWFALVTAIALSASLIVVFDRSSTPITQAPLYTHLLSGYAADKKYIWPASSLTWVIQAERFIYPVAEATRTHLMSGFNFGVTKQ